MLYICHTRYCVSIRYVRTKITTIRSPSPLVLEYCQILSYLSNCRVILRSLCWSCVTYHEKFSYDKVILLFTASHIELISFKKIFFIVIHRIYLHENMKRMHHTILKEILGIYLVVSLILCRGYCKMRQLLCQLNQP